MIWKTPLQEDMDEFEEDEQLSSIYSASMGGGRALASEQERDESELIDMISIGMEDILRKINRKKLM